MITQWQYGKICEMIGAGRADVVSTKGEFDGALRKAISSDNIAVIDILLPPDDKSPALAHCPMNWPSGGIQPQRESGISEWQIANHRHSPNES